MPVGYSPNVHNTDGFAPPTFNGAKASMVKKITYLASGAKDLFELPAGAVITGWRAIVGTAFDDSLTNTLSIGKTGSAAFFANALDVSAKTVLTPASTGGDPAAIGAVLAVPTTVTATVATTGTGASNGEAVIEFEYILLGPNDTIEDVS